MFELKPITLDAVPAAVEKADRYRLLNEPIEAESICLDVLEVDPDNTKALVTLLLALSDQFARRPGEKYAQARALLERLGNDYDRLYYEGILCERRAMVSLSAAGPGSGFVAYEWFRRAMQFYGEAHEMRPEGNDDTTLRWNTCARVINHDSSVVPQPDEVVSDMLE